MKSLPAVHFRSLQRKLLLPLFLLNALLFAGAVWGVYEVSERQSTEKLRERAQLVANMVNYSVESFSRPGELQRIVAAIGAEPDILDIVVVGGRPSRVIASTRGAWSGKLLADLPADEVGDDLAKAIELGTSHSHFNGPAHLYDFTAPLLLSRQDLANGALSHGAVMVHLDTRSIRDAVLRSTRWFLGAFLTALLVVSALAWLLFHRLVLRPVGRIKDAVASRQTVGDEVWTPIETDDELGGLALTLHSALDRSDLAIKELERQGAVLAESERRWQFALEGAGDGVWDWNIVTNFVFYSPRWKAMLGYREDEIEEVVEAWTSRIHPDDLEATLANVQRHLRKETDLYQDEHRVICKDGTCKWILDRGKVVEWAPDGKPLRMIGTHVDVTELKMAQAALADQAMHTRAIVDNIIVGVIVIDEGGVVESFNPAAETIFGYSAGEVLGRNVSMLMPSPHRDQHDRYLRRFQETRTPHIIGTEREVEGVHKDGKLIPLQLAVSELQRQGRPHYLGMMRDITERRQADRMKAEFVSTVSHELRTPLTAISGSLGLIAGGALGELPSKAGHMIELAYRNCDRLTHLINDLLDMEKIVAGKLHFDLAPQPLMPLVEQAVETNRTYGLDRHVSLDIVARVTDCDVRVDAYRMLQVLSNLLSNAVKFSPEGTSVSVAVERTGPQVRISVSDVGPGIPMEFRGRIFQRFAQADSSDQRRKGGTGLGLAITRELVTRMDGDISFESEVGQGTTFCVVLPVWHPSRADELRRAADSAGVTLG